MLQVTVEFSDKDVRQILTEAARSKIQGFNGAEVLVSIAGNRKTISGSTGGPIDEVNARITFLRNDERQDSD